MFLSWRSWRLGGSFKNSFHNSRRIAIEGDLELLRAVVEDLIDASYEGFKVTVNKSDINGEAQDSIDVEMTQQALELKS